MDIKLGKVELTKNQIQHFSDLKIDGIKGFCYWPAKQELIAVAEEDIPNFRKAQIISQAKELSNIPIAKPKTLEERVAALEQKAGIAI